MDKLKRIIGILLVLCFLVAFTSCGEDSPQEVTPSKTTQTAGNETTEETAVLSLNKEYISHYEWYEDYPEMLVRSEYKDVTLDKSMEKKYPHLAKALTETSAMRNRTMQEEKDNFIADATEEFLNDRDSFSTYVSTLDVQVRRADSVAVSVLEDYGTGSYRNFNSLNYDTGNGNLLALSDVVTDIAKLPAIVEKEVTSRMWQGEFNGETAIPDYFENTPEDDITWVLDYNGITFYFDPGNIAPTNFGIQTANVTFAEHPDLFKEKYTAVPDAYIVSLPLSSPFFTDLTGDSKAEELIVSGNYDHDGRYYYTLGINSESSNYEVDWFSYDLNPYYVKTADGDSFLYVFSEESEEEDRQMILCVFSLKNGEIKQVSETDMGLLYRGNNVFALPTSPDNLLLSVYDGSTDSVFTANESGIPMRTVSVSSAEEFLNAVSPNTNIVIEKGYYNMSSFISEVWQTQGESWNNSHDYVKLRECFDGAEIVITDVSNLYVSGETDDFADTELVVTPRYAAVLNFENCRDFGLSGITMGHTETGDCSGNVLNFSGCRNINLKSMDLYGCGVYGIGANKGTGNIYVSNSTIRDCSTGPLIVVGADGAFEFTTCTLTDSDGFGYFEKTDDCTLCFTDCTFGYYETSYFMFLEDITTENCTWSEDYIYPEYGY